MAKVAVNVENKKKKTTTKVDNYTNPANDGMNLSGTNNIQNAVGKPKTTTPSSGSTGLNTNAFNLAGTNNIRNSVGTPSAPKNTVKNDVYQATNSSNKNFNPSKVDLSSLGTKTSTKTKTNNKTNKAEDTYKPFVNYKQSYTKEDVDFLRNDFSDYLVNSPFTNSDVEYKGENYDEYMKTLNNKKAEMRTAETEVSLKKKIDDLNATGKYSDADIGYVDNNGKFQLHNYSTTISEKEEENKKLNDEIKKLNKQKSLFTDDGSLETYKAVSDIDLRIKELQDIINENNVVLEEVGGKAEYQDAVLGRMILDEAKRTNDNDTLDRLYDQYESYNDTFLERRARNLGKIGVDMASSIASAVDIARDFGSEKMAQAWEKGAQSLLENGNISVEQYNQMIDTAKEMASFDANAEDNLSTQLRNLSAQIQYDIENGEDGVAKFIGQGIDSTANFLAQFYALGPKGSLLSMSTQSATQKYFDNIQKGYDMDTSLLNAIATGVTSYLTEKIGMDNFVATINGTTGQSIYAQALNSIIKGDNNLQFVARAIASQGLAEGLEEVIEGNVDFILDSITSRIANGEPIEYNAGDIFYSMLVGAFSGGLTGTVGGYNGIVVNTREQYNNLRNDVDKLVEIRDNGLANGENVSNVERAIAVGEQALNNFENKSQTMGVTFANELVEENPDYEGEKQILTESLRPDVDEMVTVGAETDTLIQNVMNTSQDFLDINEVNMPVDEFVSLSDEQRTHLMENAQKINQIFPNVNLSYSTSIGDNALIIKMDGEKPTIIVNPNGDTSAVVSTVHEVVHTLENTDAYQELFNTVFPNAESFQNKFNELSEDRYKGDDFSTVRKEALTVALTEDLMGDEGAQAFIDHLSKYNTSTAYRLLYNFENATGLFRDNSTLGRITRLLTDALSNQEAVYLSDDVAFSKRHDYDSRRQMYDFIAEYKANGEKAFLHGNTRMSPLSRIGKYQWMPEGMPNSPILIQRRALEGVLSGKKSIGHNEHGKINENILKNLDYLMDNPLAVFESKTIDGAYMVILDAKDNNGYPIIASLSPRQNAKWKMNYYDVNFDRGFGYPGLVTGIYGKDNFEFATDENGNKYLTKKGRGHFDKFFYGLSDPVFPKGQTKSDVIKSVGRLLLSASPDTSLNSNITDYLRKSRQLEIIQESNPMLDDIHTGIRSIDDILTFEEAMEDLDDVISTPDWTVEDAQKALEDGHVMVFSSKPIEAGVFVTPSMQQAKDYAGKKGKVYGTDVDLNDVAWVDSIEGQYAPTFDEASRLEFAKNNKVLDANNPQHILSAKEEFESDEVKKRLKYGDEDNDNWKEISDNIKKDSDYVFYHNLHNEMVELKKVWDEAQAITNEKIRDILGLNVIPLDIHAKHKGLGNIIINPGAKSVNSAETKVMKKRIDEPDFDASTLRDQNRWSVQVESIEDIPEVINSIRKNIPNTDLEIKNGNDFYEIDKDGNLVEVKGRELNNFGYVGFHITWSENGINSEIQVTPDFDRKLASDKFYDKWRRLDYKKMSKEKKIEYQEDRYYSKELWKASVEGNLPSVISKIIESETGRSSSGLINQGRSTSTQSLDDVSNLPTIQPRSDNNNVGESASLTIDNPLGSDNISVPPSSNDIITQDNQNGENIVRDENGETIQFSSGGENGLRALLNSSDASLRERGESLKAKLLKANRMEKKGDSKDKIWDTTGWIKKKDGKWRFQFYDGAEDTFNRLVNYLSRADGKTIGWLDGSLSIADLVGENNILLDMYPELKDIAISFYSDKSNADTLGGYTRGQDLGGGYRVKPSISFNVASYRNGSGYLNFDFNAYDDIANTFFHELQHAIQDLEGFEGGTNLQMSAYDIDLEQNAQAREEKEKIENLLKDTGIIRPMSALDDYNFARRYGGQYMTDFRSKYSDEQTDLLEQLHNVQSILNSRRVEYLDAYDRYRKNLGEIEAREEARRALDEEERGFTPRYDGYLKSQEIKDKFGRTNKTENNIQYSRRSNARRVEGEVVDSYGETRQQKFPENLDKSTVLNSSQKEDLRQRVANNEFTYQSLVNKAEVQKAREYMQRDGIDKYFKDYMDNNSPSAKTVVAGEVLLAELAKNKDSRWEQVATKLADDATIAGQFLQAYSIMQRLTPDGQLVALTRNMNRMQQSLDNRFGNKAPKLELKENLKEDLLNATTAEEAERARDAIYKDLMNQTPKTVSDVLNSWRYLAMLANPRTHIRNILGNGVFLPTIELKNAIGTALESTVGKSLGMEHRTKSLLNPFSNADKALIDLGKNKYEEHKGAIEKNQKYERKQFSDKNIFGRGLNKISDFNSWALDQEDFMFSKDRFARSYAQFLKSNGLDTQSLTEEMDKRATEYAMLEAEKATYRDANAVAEWLNELEYSDKKGLRMASAFKKAVIPFTKTPMNIIKRGARYSPAGLLYTITYDSKQLADGKIDANQYLDNMASGLTGTSIAMLGALLASMGIFRTKDDDKNRKQYFDSENGEQDYAIDLSPFGINGTYTVDWASPVVMPFAMGAELFNSLKDMDSITDVINSVGDISAKLFDPMIETSMLSSLQDALKSFSTEGGEWLGDVVLSVATSYVNQLFPTLGGQIARTIDDTRRTTYPNSGPIDRAIKQIYNKIPWMSKLNRPYINRQGQEEKSEDLGMGMFGRGILNMISPGYYSSKDIDEYDEELYRLYDETGSLDAFPSNSSSSVTYDKEDYKFTPEQYTEWHKKRWQTETEYVNQFIDSKAYQNLTDEERVETIKDIRSYAQKVAKQEFLKSQGIDYDDKQLSGAEGAIDNGIELYAYFDYLNNAGSKQAEKVAYLEKSGLSKKQKDYLWSLNDYKKSYEDVYEKVFGGTNNSSSKSKSSSKSTKKSSKASSGTSSGRRLSGGGSSSGTRPSYQLSSLSTNRPNTDVFNTNVANAYLNAYSNNLGGSTREGNGVGARVVCPRCKNTVTPINGRCPVCGNGLQ